MLSVALAALATLGGAWAVTSVLDRVAAVRPGAREILRTERPALSALLLALVLAPILAPSSGWLARQWGRPPDPRWGLYHRVGAWLDEHAAPGDAVASVEVGFLGYSSRRPVLDLLGLVSPGVRSARREDRLADLVAARSPRYILDVPWLHPHALDAVLGDPSIARAYRPVAAFPVDGGKTVRLLAR